MPAAGDLLPVSTSVIPFRDLAGPRSSKDLCIYFIIDIYLMDFVVMLTFFTVLCILLEMLLLLSTVHGSCSSTVEKIFLYL